MQNCNASKFDLSLYMVTIQFCLVHSFCIQGSRHSMNIQIFAYQLDRILWWSVNKLIKCTSNFLGIFCKNGKEKNVTVVRYKQFNAICFHMMKVPFSPFPQCHRYSLIFSFSHIIIKCNIRHVLFPSTLCTPRTLCQMPNI